MGLSHFATPSDSYSKSVLLSKLAKIVRHWTRYNTHDQWITLFLTNYTSPGKLVPNPLWGDNLNKMVFNWFQEGSSCRFPSFYLFRILSFLLTSKYIYIYTVVYYIGMYINQYIYIHMCSNIHIMIERLDLWESCRPPVPPCVMPWPCISSSPPRDSMCRVNHENQIDFRICIIYHNIMNLYNI